MQSNYMQSRVLCKRLHANCATSANLVALLRSVVQRFANTLNGIHIIVTSLILPQIDSIMHTNNMDKILQETQRLKAQNDVVAKHLDTAKDSRRKEDLLHHLLQYELIKINQAQDRLRRDTNKVEEEQRRLVRIKSELIKMNKHITFYNHINNYKMEMKRRAFEALQDKLNSLEFTVEEVLQEPSRSISSFTQYIQRPNII